MSKEFEVTSPKPIIFKLTGHNATIQNTVDHVHGSLIPALAKASTLSIDRDPASGQITITVADAK